MLPLPRLWHCVRFARPCHSDSPKLHLRHIKMLRRPRNCKNATAQSVAPATRKRYASVDMLLKYCACHGQRKRNLNACHKTPQKRAICEQIDLQHVILITLCDRRPIVRPSELIANMPRTVGHDCGRARARAIQPPDIQSFRETQKFWAALFLLSDSRCDIRKSLVSHEFKPCQNLPKWILAGLSGVGLSTLLDVGSLRCFTIQH